MCKIEIEIEIPLLSIYKYQYITTLCSVFGEVGFDKKAHNLHLRIRMKPGSQTSDDDL